MPQAKRQLQLPAPPLRQRGFSLVEALIVVVVILVLAAIAVANVLRARMKANEAAAIANMRTIHTAEAMYYDAYPQVGYAGSLPDLGSHGSTCETTSKTSSCLLMDDALTSGLKSGYIFDLLGDGQVPSQAYRLTASPEGSGTTGRCTFTSDQTGTITVETPGSSGKPGHFILAGKTCDPS